MEAGGDAETVPTVVPVSGAGFSLVETSLRFADSRARGACFSKGFAGGWGDEILTRLDGGSLASSEDLATSDGGDAARLSGTTDVEVGVASVGLLGGRVADACDVVSLRFFRAGAAAD